MHKTIKDSAISIRAATVSDLTGIVSILNHQIKSGRAVWTSTPVTFESRKEWFRLRSKKGFPVLVAVAEAEVVGFGSFGEFRGWDGYNNSVEHSIYVTDAFQRNGIGRKLLSQLTQEAQKLGKHVMIAGIESTNIPSISLHQQLGFGKCGHLKEVGRRYDCWIDLLFMQKFIG